MPRMELGPMGFLKIIRLVLWSAGEGMDCCPVVPCGSLRAGFLPSDADGVQPGLCLLRFGFIGTKINLNCAVPNWKWLEILPRHLN